MTSCCVIAHKHDTTHFLSGAGKTHQPMTKTTIGKRVDLQPIWCSSGCRLALRTR